MNNMKQYEIKYIIKGVTGTYYMPLVSEYDLSLQDIFYSARMELTKFLGTGEFTIVSIIAV